jgi:uncharacterized OB-fold protein
MLSERSIPKKTPLTQPFFDAAASGTLCVQRCSSCGHRWFPPTTQCGACLSTNFGWEPVSGRARVWSWVVMHQPYLPAFKDETPYPVVLVQLEEGPFMMSGVTRDTVEKLACDLPVQATFELFGEGTPMPLFRAVEEAVV